MRKISIDEECAAELFRSMMRDDYLGLKEQIRDLEVKDTLRSFETEDYVTSKQNLAAMEVLLGYYFTESEAAEIIAKN